jgi:hypothetical protein
VPDQVRGEIQSAAAMPPSHWNAMSTTNQRSVVRKLSSRSCAKSAAARAAVAGGRAVGWSLRIVLR